MAWQSLADLVPGALGQNVMQNPKFLQALKEVNDRRAAYFATLTPQQQALVAEGLQPDVCPDCKGAGVLKVEDAVEYGMGKIALIPCPCDRTNRVARMTRVAGLESHAEDTFENHPPQTGIQEEMYPPAYEYSQAPSGWLVLTGSYGRGKSHLSRCIGNEWIAAGHPVVYRETGIMLDEIKATFSHVPGDGEVATDDLWNAFMNAKLLILDEFPATHETSWVVDRLWTLINHRWLERMPTVITTNWSLEEFQDRHPRWASRFLDERACQILDFR